MSAYSNRTTEDQLVQVQNLGRTDTFRSIKDGQSTKINMDGAATSLKAPLEDIGFITTDTIGSGGSNRQAYRSVNANYTLTVDDSVVTVDVTSGNLTITLPVMADVWDATNSRGQVFTVKIGVPSGSNTVTVVGSGGSTIDGQSSIVLTSGAVPYPGIEVIPDGTNWFVKGS